jgi:hypothetical protein
MRRAARGGALRSIYICVSLTYEYHLGDWPLMPVLGAEVCAMLVADFLHCQTEALSA